MDYKILLDIAIILVGTKLGGIGSRHLKMPQVLGALVAGVIIGPSILGIVHKNEYIELLAQLGVVMLMFLAGLETDVEEFKKAGISSFLIAVGGIILPLIAGFFSARIFFPNNFYESLFVGVILTATSVSISVQVLTELGKLKTRAGMNIVGAAVIDDILGLVVLSFVTSLALTSKRAKDANITSDLLTVSLKVLLFCVVSLVLVAFLSKYLNKYFGKRDPRQRITIFAIAFGLVCAYMAEELGIAAITGAYVAGLALSPYVHKEAIQRKVYDISTYFLTPVFFASVGIATEFKAMDSKLWFLTILMLITAIFGKIIGCGGTAKLFGLSNAEALQIGMGMISRGEVALITTNMGLQKHIITEKLFAPTLIVVVVTTLVTPILLKLSFSHKIEKKII